MECETAFPYCREFLSKIKAVPEVPDWDGVEYAVKSCTGVPVPVFPLGITKFRMAFCGVPEFVTAASVPGSPVVTLPTFTVAAVPSSPDGPVGPVAPVGPVTPVGPVGPVIPCGPVAPVGPVTPVGPVGPVILWVPSDR